MCIILIGRITSKQFNQALSQNRDGFSLYTQQRGLVKEPPMKLVNEVIAAKEFGIWHFRIATSGKLDKYNIHPFTVCRGKYYLYHNGVLGAGLGEMSDTHALAETLKDVSLTTARTVLSSLTGAGRFVLANRYDVRKFELFGNWECEAGVLMSHKMYPQVTTYRGYTHAGKGGNTNSTGYWNGGFRFED